MLFTLVHSSEKADVMEIDDDDPKNERVIDLTETDESDGGC